MRPVVTQSGRGVTALAQVGDGVSPFVPISGQVAPPAGSRRGVGDSPASDSSNRIGTESSADTTAASATDYSKGTNSLVQAAKARARGYRSKTKMITIGYLIAGKLSNPSPYVAHPI